ncbi:MAG: hypothetical protein HXY35_05475 [Chloroflexi bacterium]|nr:hypothetical protein [Chloroflexota bacterium]
MTSSNGQQPKNRFEEWSSLATIVVAILQVVVFISQIALLSNLKSVISVIFYLVSILVVIICIYVLTKKKEKVEDEKKIIRYAYSSTQRNGATILLSLNIVAYIYIGIILITKPCLHLPQPFSDDQFGILVADFREGGILTENSKDLADQAARNLRTRIDLSNTHERIVVERICGLKDKTEAIRVGQKNNAMLVIWGDVNKSSPENIRPYLIFTKSEILPNSVDEDVIQADFQNVELSNLPTQFSVRTTALSTFALGYIYLTKDQTPQGFTSAINEFSVAIKTLEPELKPAPALTEQDLALRRTLAVLYVMRGRAYASISQGDLALNDYDKAVEIDPDYYATYIAMGNYFYSNKQYEQARYSYEKSLQKKRDSICLHGVGKCILFLR